MRLVSRQESLQDDSVNFVFEGDFPGFFEARYVRRTPEYFVVYLSSQSGCAQACRMCHLTATRQMKNEDATPAQFMRQAKEVLSWYANNCDPAEVVHFNFMARGEALSNEYLLWDGEDILSSLGDMASKRGLFPQYLISTILPRNLRGMQLTDIFERVHPEIYYSLYSVDRGFRKKWLPKALEADEGLEMLSHWQERTRKIPVLHWAFIEGENDSPEDVKRLCEWVCGYDLRVDFNIVRYNSPSDEYGRESPEKRICRNAEIIRKMMPEARVRVIPRVGYDVQASCGMFVPKNAAC